MVNFRRNCWRNSDVLQLMKRCSLYITLLSQVSTVWRLWRRGRPLRLLAVRLSFCLVLVLCSFIVNCCVVIAEANEFLSTRKLGSNFRTKCLSMAASQRAGSCPSNGLSAFMPLAQNTLVSMYILTSFIAVRVTKCHRMLRISAVRARDGVVVKALRYKPAGRGFDSRWCQWSFSVT